MTIIQIDKENVIIMQIYETIVYQKEGNKKVLTPRKILFRLDSITNTRSRFEEFL